MRIAPPKTGPRHRSEIRLRTKNALACAFDAPIDRRPSKGPDFIRAFRSPPPSPCNVGIADSSPPRREDGRFSVKVRLLVLLGVGFLTIASSVPAAAGDCRDALISDPPKRYLCTSAYAYTEDGPPYLQGTSSFEAEFVEASPRDPAVFVMRAANGNETYCACNSRGSAARPSFLSSMAFTCQGSSVMRGTSPAATATASATSRSTRSSRRSTVARSSTSEAACGSGDGPPFPFVLAIEPGAGFSSHRRPRPNPAITHRRTATAVPPACSPGPSIRFRPLESSSSWERSPSRSHCGRGAGAAITACCTQRVAGDRTSC